MVFSNRLSPSGQGRSDAPQGLPPVAALYRLLNGYLIGRAIHVAAQLGVADVLREGPRSTTEIATAVGAHAPTLIGCSAPWRASVSSPRWSTARSH